MEIRNAKLEQQREILEKDIRDFQTEKKRLIDSVSILKHKLTHANSAIDTLLTLDGAASVALYHLFFDSLLLNDSKENKMMK